MFGSKGLLDFYINGNLQWMIEIDREGERLNDHLERFASKEEIQKEEERQKKKPKTSLGLYSEIERKEWVIIDFRHQSAYINYPIPENVWIVSYSDDYTGAIVKRNGGVELPIQFMGDMISIPNKSLEKPSLEKLLADNLITESTYKEGKAKEEKQQKITYFQKRLSEARTKEDQHKFEKIVDELMNSL